MHMDKEHVRLLVWGAFGVTGFLFFFLLIEMLRRFHGTKITAARAYAVEEQKNGKVVATSILRDFAFWQLEIATNRFGEENFLRDGHSGKFYQGSLEEGEMIVVKCIDVGRLGRDGLEAEIGVLEGLSHNRLIPLLGYCLENENMKMLVYKQMPNGDLASALRRGSDELSKTSDESDESKNSSSSSENSSSKPLDWITRFKIAIGVAEGLVYLHHECNPPIVHSDLKGSSILLDESYEVRLGSMGKALRQNEANIFPVYDIYSYGRVLLDLISGLDISGGYDPYAEAWLQKALPLMGLQHKEALAKLVDPSLVVDEDHIKEVLLLAVIAKSCLDPDQVQHQTMSNILNILQNPVNSID